MHSEYMDAVRSAERSSQGWQGRAAGLRVKCNSSLSPSPSL